MNKIKLRVVTTFSGLGMQERGIQNSGLFDMDVVNTCETDSDVIIAYAAVHHDLTKADVICVSGLCEKMTIVIP